MVNHVNFIQIINYLKNGTYPEEIKDKGKKANFRKIDGEYLFPEGVFISYQEISTGEYIFPRK